MYMSISTPFNSTPRIPTLQLSKYHAIRQVSCGNLIARNTYQAPFSDFCVHLRNSGYSTDEAGQEVIEAFADERKYARRDPEAFSFRREVRKMIN
jgi:hypothetical protein